MVGSRGSLLIFAIALSVALAFPHRQYPAVAQCMVTGAKVPVCANPGSATSLPGRHEQGRGPPWLQDLPLPRLSFTETTIFWFSSPGKLPGEVSDGATVGCR